MQSPSAEPPFGAVGRMLWTSSTEDSRFRHLLQTEESVEEAPLFADYVPSSKDQIALPRYVLYILMGTTVIMLALYGIVGHLLKDLVHDFADWALGSSPVQRNVYELLGEEERMSRGMEASAPEENQRGPLPGLQIEL